MKLKKFHIRSRHKVSSQHLAMKHWRIFNFTSAGHWDTIMECNCCVGKKIYLLRGFDRFLIIAFFIWWVLVRGILFRIISRLAFYDRYNKRIRQDAEKEETTQRCPWCRVDVLQWNLIWGFTSFDSCTSEGSPSEPPSALPSSSSSSLRLSSILDIWASAFLMSDIAEMQKTGRHE